MDGLLREEEQMENCNNFCDLQISYQEIRTKKMIVDAATLTFAMCNLGQYFEYLAKSGADSAGLRSTAGPSSAAEGAVPVASPPMTTPSTPEPEMAFLHDRNPTRTPEDPVWASWPELCLRLTGVRPEKTVPAMTPPVTGTMALSTSSSRNLIF